MATYYVDGAIGSDLNPGTGPGARDAWKTIDHAMNNVVGKDKVWVKASATYTESPAIDTAVGAIADEIVFEGYTSSTGDGGQITLVGMLTDTIVDVVGYCFINFIFNADSSNVNCTQLGSSSISWRNCIFKLATGDGHTQGGAGCYYECEFIDNGGDGAAITSGKPSVFINCKFYRNGASGIDSSGCTICYNCLFFSNGTHAINGGSSHDTCVTVFNCTIDGDAKDTLTGILKSSTARGFVAAVNNIVYDCTTGISSVYGDRSVLVYNLLNSNTADYAGDASDQEGGVSGAPDFVNEVGGANYQLNHSSPGKSAGTDWADNMDIGAYQVPVLGQLLMPNKRANKQ